jgi:hypothetical protein
MAQTGQSGYNPEMGTMHNANTAAELDAWLRAGGRVVAASERAARAVLASYHRQRRA